MHPSGQSVKAALKAKRPLTPQELRGATRAQLRAALEQMGVSVGELTGAEMRRVYEREQRVGKARSPIRAGVEKADKAADEKKSSKKKAGAPRPKGRKK